MGSDWMKILALAGGATATAVLGYYLLRDESAGASPAKSKSAAEMTKEDVIELLTEIVVCQSQMSNLMKEVTNIHLKENLTFEQVYHQVKARQSRDPLQEHGLSIEEFDALLDKHQKDDEVKKGIRDVLTAGSVKLSASAPSRQINRC